MEQKDRTECKHYLRLLRREKDGEQLHWVRCRMCGKSWFLGSEVQELQATAEVAR